jgi:alpha-methylacyl-CoA racemase
MLLAFGIACGVIEARASGRGQVVDAAMVDGASLLATMFSGLVGAGQWRDGERGVNVLDSGAPWYDTYATRDGKHVAIGAIEARFYVELLARLGFDPSLAATQHDRSTWPALRARLAARFLERSRDEWVAAFEGSDACFAPVLSFAESRRHPHVAARAGAVEIDGIAQPAPAPRFDRTPGAVTGPPPERGSGGSAALQSWGFDAAAIEALRALGAVCR